MTHSFRDDLDGFISDRLTAASRALSTDDFFRLEETSLQSNARKLRTSLNPEQLELSELTTAARIVLESIRERNAYRQGFMDGLKLMTALEG